MNMKKLIQTMTDIETGKTVINESAVDECGGMMSYAPQQDHGSPVSINVSLNAVGAENVSELLNLLKNSGLQAAHGPSMPSQGMRMDIENFRSIVDSGDRADDEMDVEIGMDTKKDMKNMAKEEWVNSPSEKYADHHTMIHDLSGGINGQKKMYKPAAKGDNPMAVAHESKETIKARLLQALEEAKAKPDFLDIDGDGDKTEPMKKAVKDKKNSIEEKATGDYSAKKARAGKDIGKPGKQFAKIAKSAAERYGSKERGEKVAGAVLKKLRKK